jgi:hypothetical protein
MRPFVGWPIPRPLHLTGGDLQVAAGQVDADAVAPDAVIGLLRLDVQPAGFQRDDKLDLVMHVLGQGRVGYYAAIRHDRVGRLGEKERWRALVLPHLADVLDVIAADAPDAAHRKFFG